MILSFCCVAVVYGASLVIHAYGFLAVFAAAVTLRHTEHRMARQSLVDAGGEQDDEVAQTRSDGKEISTAGVFDRSLLFKEQLEHFSEIVLILIIGGTLFLSSWKRQAIALAAFVFLVARPAGVWLVSRGSAVSMRNRLMTGWFGIRGIGSLYYLMYAIEHGLPEDLALQLIQLVLIVVTLSILLHGVSVKPLMAWYARGKRGPEPAWRLRGITREDLAALGHREGRGFVRWRTDRLAQSPYARFLGFGF